MRNEFLFLSFMLVFSLGLCGYFYPIVLYAFILVGPILVLGFIDYFQTSNTIRRNYPILGRFRHVAEELRPKIRQYFVESDIDGRPFNRLDREVTYARANDTVDSNPFGTQKNVYKEGYEYLAHSIAAKDIHKMDQHPKVTVGNEQCSQPYDISIFNVSAMSFGSLSARAIEALNGGAKIGEFAHNTGEGGVSPYHLAQGGDLIWQLGTGYFGARAKDGGFDPGLYKETVSPEAIKMVELKLSQGAKPGHGGILPAKKNTPEIARIRKVEPGTSVLSPPYHKAFNTPTGMMEFMQQLRELSGGKPVGFKFCVGKRSEFLGICKAMIETGIYPDFISVDGGEGGTGAAPLEFSDSVGMPFMNGLTFVHDALVGFGIRDKIKLNATGKIVTGFDIFRALSLGADYCSSARGMMLALGCIQALLCNKNTCPTGVATQDKELVKGLVVADKRVKVANFHSETVHSFVELLAAAGLETPAEISRDLIYRKVNMYESKRYDEIYPFMEPGALLNAPFPKRFAYYMEAASAAAF
ncbi:MAG: FMN-binding glutamate synthase family protein [Bacteroidota bacterium]